MKPWQTVILAWIAAAFAGVIVAQMSTDAWTDVCIAGILTLLAVLVIRRSKRHMGRR